MSAARREETELWLDTSKPHLFDPQGGKRLDASEDCEPRAPRVAPARR